VWLTQMGMSFTLVRYQAYHTPVGVHVTTSRLWPLEQAEDLVVRPEERVEVEAAQEVRRRSRSVVARIIDAGLLEDGALMSIAPDTQVTAEVRDAVAEWIAEDPRRGQARWVNGNRLRCLEWLADGESWSASGLAEHIIREASGHSASITGPTWWADETGLRLHELLEEHTGEPVYATSFGERDWTEMHQLLAQLQPGEWITYKDLADAIGSSAIAVGQHVARCSACPNAYRVLTSRRTVSGGFRWDDGDRDDDPQALLESEGVRFDEAGRADPAMRRTFG
jgi:alkylated DNA nucleotide flippase Atl1